MLITDKLERSVYVYVPTLTKPSDGVEPRLCQAMLVLCLPPRRTWPIAIMGFAPIAGLVTVRYLWRLV